MKSHNNNHPHPKLKTQLFSCAFFRHCAHSVLSPTASSLPSPPLPPPPPPHINPKTECESTTTTTTSSSSSSQSFTQWRFSLPTPPPPPPPPPHHHLQTPPPPPHPNLEQLFHLPHLTSDSDSDRLSALHLLERSLVPNPPQHQPPCPPPLMRSLISNLRHPTAAKPSTKLLFALCLSHLNRRVAVQQGAVGAVVETALEMDGPPAERALAALELMCTVAEGQVEVRAHALSVPVMVTMMGKMGARGKEYAIGVLGVVYGGGVVEDLQAAPPPEEVARAVELALQGECSVRGRRKGGQLLKTLHDYGRTQLTDEQQR